MNIIRVANFGEMSIEAGKRITMKVRKNPDMILGLATGSTQLNVYKYLIEDHIKSGTSYQKIKTINLDEYVGLADANPNSYHYFMQKNLFCHIDIFTSNTHVPVGTAIN